MTRDEELSESKRELADALSRLKIAETHQREQESHFKERLAESKERFEVTCRIFLFMERGTSFQGLKWQMEEENRKQRELHERDRAELTRQISDKEHLIEVQR